MIEISSEIDTRPRVAVTETYSSDNLQVCPLGDSQSDSSCVNTKKRHKANPITLHYLLSHFLSSLYLIWPIYFVSDGTKHSELRLNRVSECQVKIKNIHFGLVL